MRQSGSEVLGWWEVFPALWRKDLLFPALFTLLLLGSLFYVWQHVQVIRLGYEIEELKKERAILLQRERELILEVARLKALPRVEEIARNRLGLTDPQPGQIIILR